MNHSLASSLWNWARWTVVVAVLAIGGLTWGSWWPPLGEWVGSVSGRFRATTSDAGGEHAANDDAGAALPVTDPKVLKISSQARKNLGLVSRPVKPQTYWKTIQVPGVIADQPGASDRGVTAPAAGVVAEVHALPGDTVRPGDLLFTLRLSSEYLQNSQSSLFKAARETELVQEKRTRLAGLAKSGAIPESQIIELDNELRRQAALMEAHRQDLIARGLTPDQVEEVAQGKFVTTIEVRVPATLRAPLPLSDVQPVAGESSGDREAGPAYEIEELIAQLGQQVAAGELLANLANHRALYIEGHAFKQDAPALERAAQGGWPIAVEFTEEQSDDWPPLQESFQIRHLANSIDPVTRTFDFFIPLTNHSRAYEKDGETFVVWRFRPGQRVRLHVPVEPLENVLVLPSSAIAREGPEAYVFRQNGDLFNRLPVHVLHEDRLNVVIANDGSVASGAYLAQGSGASLNRVLKAQAASGVRADLHVHADGTVHAAH